MGGREQGKKTLAYPMALSWWEGCFSCWADGEADLLLRPAIKPLLHPHYPSSPCSSTAAAPPSLGKGMSSEEKVRGTATPSVA